ncbi:hypothetical protein BMS83_08965 [Leuconostoc pseudomesenteroides]|nr:hypothetical protein BMS83_08965 [Leuconostoc pseudomesenteroides]
MLRDSRVIIDVQNSKGFEEMNNFTFKNTTDIRFGENRLDTELAGVVAPFGKKVLLAYGGGSIKKNGLYDRIKRALKDYEIFELSGIAPNPKIDSVREGQQLVQKNDIDVIVAVGGGSVIDAAKVVSVAKNYDGGLTVAAQLKRMVCMTVLSVR